MDHLMQSVGLAIFVDDGGPDADEFANNYIVFDPRDPKQRERAWAEAEQLWSIRNTLQARSGAASGLRPPQLKTHYPASWPL
jgi:hypothetical protein